MSKQFSDDFFWGASTSAHQVEGGNCNNWSVWERENAQRLAGEAAGKWSQETQKRFPEMFQAENYIAGVAADHFNRYEEDFDLAQEGRHNAHRFSIDWARIESREGEFDQEAIEHYKDVIRALRSRGLEPFVTLWHWTHPVWLEDRGGVLAKDFPEKFAHYAHVMVDALNASEDTAVKYVMTLNEPMSVISSCYVTGAWPHTKKGVWAVLRAYKNLSCAHIRTFRAIKDSHADILVGFTEILTSFHPKNVHSLIDRFIVKCARYWTNKRFITMTDGRYDFLGVQYYFDYTIGISGRDRGDCQRSDLEWDLHAEGLYCVITEYSQYGVPLYVTEDGLADADDRQRSQFLRDHIGQIARAISDGIDVRGYFHWSLLDNFEWDKGFWPRFGLVEVDFTTGERKTRQSYQTYREIIAEHQEMN